MAQTPMRFSDPSFDAAPLFAGAETRPELLAHLLGTLTPTWDVAAVAASLTMPILLAHGRHDYVVPHLLWADVVPKLPRATFHLFEASGHQPFAEEPARFTAVLGDWLRAD